MGIRQSLLSFAPPSLRDPQSGGGRFLYTVGLLGDALIDKLEQALLARMPQRCDPSALPLLGADRMLAQGPGETPTQYALRLRQAFATWQRAGIDSGVLRQVLGFLDAYKPRARIVDDSANWTSAAPGVDPALPFSYRQSQSNWNWDNEGDPHPKNVNAWWRWWLVLYSTSTSGGNWAGTRPVCGGGMVCGDITKACGVGIPADTFRAIRTILGQSKRAGTWCRWIVIAFSDSLFLPTATADDVINPNGGWSSWGKKSGNLYVRARPVDGAYCDGWATTGSTAAADFPNY